MLVCTPQSWCSNSRDLVISEISLNFPLSICTGYDRMENTGNEEMKQNSWQTIHSFWLVVGTVAQQCPWICDQPELIMPKSLYHVLAKITKYCFSWESDSHVCSITGLASPVLK